MVTRRDNPFWRTKHESILEAAFGEFTRHGFELASMEKIAESARVSKVTVYNHFTTKERLFIAAIEHFFEFLHQPFVYVIDGREPGDRELMACIESLIAYYFIPVHVAMVTLLRSERSRCAALGIRRSEADLFPPTLVSTLAATMPGTKARALALSELICTLIHRYCLEAEPGRKSDDKRRTDVQTRVIALLQDAEVLRQL